MSPRGGTAFLDGKAVRYRSSGGEQCFLEFDTTTVVVSSSEGGTRRTAYRAHDLGSNRYLLCWWRDGDRADLVTALVDFRQGKLVFTRPSEFDASPFDEAEIMSLDTR